MRGVLQGDPPYNSLAFRIMSRFTGQWKRLASGSEKFEAVSTRPLSTSYQHFDAMLAGCVEYLCVKNEIPVPSWVYPEPYFLDQFWWRTELPGTRAIEMVEIPGAPSNR